MADEERLERALIALGRELDYPEAPGLAPAVGERLRAQPVPLRRRVHRPRRVALLAAAAVLLLAGAAVAVRFVIRGVDVVTTPTPPPAPVGPPGSNLGLGDPTTLAGARAAVEFPIVIPTVPGLESPAGAFVSEDVPGGRVTLTYEPNRLLPRDERTGLGMLLTQFRGSIDRAVLVKLAGAPDVEVQRVNVGDAPAFWISGGDHVVFYQDEDGQAFSETVRLAGNVLLWERGDVTLRLEADTTQERALRIAESVK